MALIILTSTVRVSAPPRRSNFCSCKTRRSFDCVLRLMSPISSRNIVPLFASSNLANLLSVAPVNAPFSCPKSSLSINVSGTAAQFIIMRGSFLRLLRLWISLATSSLPLPLSPWISTVTSVVPTFSILSNTSFIASLWPMISPMPPNRPISKRRRAFSSCKASLSEAFFAIIRSSSISYGFAI